MDPGRVQEADYLPEVRVRVDERGVERLVVARRLFRHGASTRGGDGLTGTDWDGGNPESTWAAKNFPHTDRA